MFIIIWLHSISIFFRNWNTLFYFTFHSPSFCPYLNHWNIWIWSLNTGSYSVLQDRKSPILHLWQQKLVKHCICHTNVFHSVFPFCNQTAEKITAKAVRNHKKQCLQTRCERRWYTDEEKIQKGCLTSQELQQ